MMTELTHQESLESMEDQIALVFKVGVPGFVELMISATPEGLRDMLERIEVPETRADLQRLGPLN